MTRSLIQGVRIAGIGRALPSERISFMEEAQAAGMEAAQAARMQKSLGLGTRARAGANHTSADFCQAAAQSLLKNADQDPAEIGLLVCVTQTAEYRQPADSCLLHGRLGLSPDCACMDLNLGCSGYIYGLWQCFCAMTAGGIDKALLLAGDTVGRQVNPGDRAVAPLFGDGGSATLLCRDSEAPAAGFILGSDGSGWKALNVPAGGFRMPSSPDTRIETRGEDGNVRSLDNLFMDGGAVMNFTLRQVPPLLRDTFQLMGWTKDDPDAFVMHQANAFILTSIARMSGLPISKVPWDSFTELGNLSSASVPFALAHALSAAETPLSAQLKAKVMEAPLRLVLAGFGVGLSWGAAALETGSILCPEAIILDSGK